MIAETGNRRIIEVDRDGKIVHEIPLTVDQPELAQRHPAGPEAAPTATTSSATRATAWSASMTPTGKVVWS